MRMFAMNEARKAPRIGSLAMISGALLGSLGVAGPAFSADLPGFYQSDSYDTGCYQCAPPCAYPCAPPPEERTVIEHAPVAERHWVQRDYIERRYAAYSSTYPSYRYSYYPGPEVYDTCHGTQYDHCGQTYQAYEAAPFRRYGYEGGYVPPYRYASHYRPPYDYDYRPYEHERSPRPPGSVPNSYYGPYYK